MLLLPREGAVQSGGGGWSSLWRVHCREVHLSSGGRDQLLHQGGWGFKLRPHCDITFIIMQVRVDGDKYVHLKVFRALPHTGSKITLSAVQKDKTLEDPIDFF